MQDNGVGFNANAARGGLGLLGMQERVQELDGTVVIASNRSGGTTIRVELPAGVVA